MLIDAFKKVYRRPRYLSLAFCMSILTFSLAVWLPNIRVITAVVTSAGVPFASKIMFPLSLLGSIATNFSPFSALSTIVIALLFGMYIGLLAYFLRHRAKEVRQNGVAQGFLGLVSGILGVGCAACGSFLFTSLSFVGASGVLTFLPLGGLEFGILGMILLAMAIYMTAKKIQDPMTCIIES